MSGQNIEARREMRGSRERGLVMLLTGHTTGIGRALWRRLAGEIAGRTHVEVAGAVGLARSADPKCSTDRLVHVCGDVASLEDCRRAVATAIDRFGRLDVLINNAAVRPATHLASPPQAWVECISVNLVGTYFCTSAALPYLLDSKHGGVVINLLSAEAYNATPGGSGYSASKAGVEALTRSLGRELAATSVRVLGFMPGNVRTGMNPSGPREPAAVADDLLRLLLWEDLASGAILAYGGRGGQRSRDEDACVRETMVVDETHTAVQVP